MCYVSFKPYYKWITFNTETKYKPSSIDYSLGFKPYYKWITFNTCKDKEAIKNKYYSFKPYYKWITFNTIFFGMEKLGYGRF